MIVRLWPQPAARRWRACCRASLGRRACIVVVCSWRRGYHSRFRRNMMRRSKKGLLVDTNQSTRSNKAYLHRSRAQYAVDPRWEIAMTKSISTLLGLVSCLVSTSVSSAADIKVLSGGNMASILNELRGTFEKSSSHKIAIDY